jgi:hypothetical protein
MEINCFFYTYTDRVNIIKTDSNKEGNKKKTTFRGKLHPRKNKYKKGSTIIKIIIR